MTRYPVPMLLLLLLCSGCIFKSDNTGAADEIIRELLYTDSAGQVLLLALTGNCSLPGCCKPAAQYG